MISIIFSFYNEQESLPVLFKRIRDVMSQENEQYELIFVNDNSTDNSSQIISKQEKIPGESIIAVNMSRRFGVEECFMAGIEVAQGDAVILMYVDMQDPPETIHEMLAKWRQGTDIVHTVRRTRIGENPAKILISNIAYKWINATADIEIPRNAGDFKLISRRAVNYIRTFTETEPYLRGLISWVGFKQDYVYYDLQPRLYGNSKVPLFGKKALKVLLSGLVSFSGFPIYLIIFLTCAGLIGSLVILLFLFLSNQLQNPLGWITFFLITLWAITMGAVSIIGVYILRVYQNTTHRPPYIIKDITR
ncbi:MAG: glycosyltransferase family 2 protein [Candidatus Omnitrophica bacterium]|nr:glycosyltransferase family 2 protein [Candidatus Omnitrophota bacterium]